MDECAANSGLCDATNGGCTNTVGSYTCTCNAGYVLNGDGSACDGTLTLILTLSPTLKKRISMIFNPNNWIILDLALILKIVHIFYV